MGLAERWRIFTVERINQGSTMKKGINYHPVYGIHLPFLPPPLEKMPKYGPAILFAMLMCMWWLTKLCLPQNELSHDYQQSLYLRDLGMKRLYLQYGANSFVPRFCILTPWNLVFKTSWSLAAVLWSFKCCLPLHVLRKQWCNSVKFLWSQWFKSMRDLQVVWNSDRW